ncbi:hypothetical protein EEL31_12995 [Brevibacillus laterosporus]|nr:hypothetical protein [Brevibacillus laterosporus]TPG69344.1 hypothetical protein EEL31_12995 [Brevibacillus laterosporus]
MERLGIFNRVIREYGPFVYDSIVELNYYIDVSSIDEVSILDIKFVIQAETYEQLEMQMRFKNVSQYTLRKVSGIIGLTRDLIVVDNKDKGWTNEMRYYVHDDSGYGEGDGFGVIEFYCQSIEVISIKPV